MGRLFLLFTIVPLVELYLLLWLGRQIGFWPTVAIVVVTGAVGAALAKREGLRVLRQWQGTLAQGRMPEEGLLGAVLVLVGGVFLVTPGVMTDIAGLLLLIPASRRVIARKVRSRLERSVRSGGVRVSTFGFGPRPGGPPSPPPPRAADPSDGSWEKVSRATADEEDAEIVDDRGRQGPV